RRARPRLRLAAREGRLLLGTKRQGRLAHAARAGALSGRWRHHASRGARRRAGAVQGSVLAIQHDYDLREEMMQMNSRHAWLVAAALIACVGAVPAWAVDCNAASSLRLVNGKFHTMDQHDKVVSAV